MLGKCVPQEHLHALRHHLWTTRLRMVAAEQIRPSGDAPTHQRALAALGSDAACSVYGVYRIEGDNRLPIVVVSHPREAMCNRMHLDGLQALLSIPNSLMLPPAFFLVATAGMMHLMAGARVPEGSPSHAAEVAAIRSAHVRTTAIGAACVALATVIDVGGVSETLNRLDPALTDATARAGLFAATLFARACVRWMNGAAPAHRVMELDDAFPPPC